MALIDHAPNAGNWFDPIDEIVVSIVLQAQRSTVVRDFGFGRSVHQYGAGLVLLSPPSRPSFWRFDGQPLILHFSFPTAALSSLVGDDATSLEHLITCAARTPKYDTLVTRLASRMWARRGMNGATSFTERALGTILSLILEDAAAEKGCPPTGKATLPSWRLEKALTAIREHKQRIRISTLASQLGLSTDHFIRAFKAATGLSPHEMASELTIEAAKKLLRETGQSVTSISMELGYSSPAHFSERFKQATGMPPTEWRATYTQ